MTTCNSELCLRVTITLEQCLLCTFHMDHAHADLLKCNYTDVSPFHGSPTFTAIVWGVRLIFLFTVGSNIDANSKTYNVISLSLCNAMHLFNTKIL